MLPNKIKKGDTIGVIAPSNIAHTDDLDEINKAITLMENTGYKIEFGKYVFENTLGYGPTPIKKAEDINNMFENPNINAIFCIKGGFNSNTTFDYINYDIISKNPKIICGFSDSTSILNQINAKTGLVTFHGATFKSLVSWETDYSFKSCIDTFEKENTDLNKYNDTYKSKKKGIGEGRLIGGNLSITSQLVCGKYKIDFTDKILFIEELGFETNPMLASNYLYYMKQNGVFDKIKGMWIGNYEHESGISLEQIVLDVLEEKYTFPIIKSNNFGHTDKKIVIPIGTLAKIENDKIEILEKCVK